MCIFFLPLSLSVALFLFLLHKNMHARLLYGLNFVPPPNSYVKVLTPSDLDYDYLETRSLKG